MKWCCQPKKRLESERGDVGYKSSYESVWVLSICKIWLSNLVTTMFYASPVPSRTCRSNVTPVLRDTGIPVENRNIRNIKITLPRIPRHPLRYPRYQ
jgi:hypothetical protein